MCFFAKFFHFHFLHFAEQIGCENEVVEVLVCSSHHVVFGALPFLAALVYEQDVFADAHHRVHVVGVDDGCDVVLLSD